MTHPNQPYGTGHSGVTVAAPTAQTAVNPAALTSAAATGGDSPTEAEYNALRTDVSNVRTQVVALVTDMTNSRTFENALRTSLRNGGIIA